MTSLAALEQLNASPSVGAAEAVPHVVAWNLTRRCNLECAHCYITAGPDAAAVDELDTEACLRIADEILAVNPSPMFIFSGGEPLLRDDLTTLTAHASSRGATVVVGTNGTLLTDARIRALADAGVTGVAVSVESLDAKYHDRFRRSHGALRDTLAGVDRLVASGMDFVVQTTVTRGNRDELPAIAAWAAERGAVSFNVYFVVTTGRGERMVALDAAEREAVLEELVDLHRTYLGRMMVRAKCAPQFMRLVRERVPESPMVNYATRCPCGVQYCRIMPDGGLTACPYLPLPVGNLRHAPFADLWRDAALFAELRRAEPGGKCGRCEYREVCGGCRAAAYATGGDALGEDPNCAYDPPGDRALVRPPAVAYGDDASEPSLPWTPDALARVGRIPSFVRGVVVQRVEAYARRRGSETVTIELMQEVRQNLPIDFSKRLPNFVRRD